MDILLIAHFCSDFDGKGNNRFNYIASMLADKGFQVELVTSDFSHINKTRRSKVIGRYNYKITLISEPGYYKNVSLKRIYSHCIMGRNLKKYLNTRNKPDVIYCAVPSLSVAKVAAEYALKYKIRFIIDIQDLWPAAFQMVFKMPIISNVLFLPIQKQANFIYATADEIIAVSDTYKDRALKVNNKSKKGYTIYLGTDLSIFDMLAETNIFLDKPNNEIWLAYVGTLGHSYDLTSVIDALEILKKNGIDNIRFIVMGDGPLKAKFENYALVKKVDAIFTGRLAYGEMIGMLKACDIAVNPISSGAAQSIINKHADYAAAGLPVINTQECIEYRRLVDDYKIGLNCKNDDTEDLANKLMQLYENEELRHMMGLNHRKLAEDRFDRARTYKEIVNIIFNKC